MADHEFVGDRWLGWLQLQKIPFIIRIRNSSYTENIQGKSTCVDGLFYTLKPGEARMIEDVRPLENQAVYLSGLRLNDRDLLVVASSDKFHPGSDSDLWLALGN